MITENRVKELINEFADRYWSTAGDPRLVGIMRRAKFPLPEPTKPDCICTETEMEFNNPNHDCPKCHPPEPTNQEIFKRASKIYPTSTGNPPEPEEKPGPTIAPSGTVNFPGEVKLKFWPRFFAVLNVICWAALLYRIYRY